MPTYTRADLKSRMNAKIKGKIGMLTNSDDTCNEAVRIVSSEIDLRSMESSIDLAPNLFSDVKSYAAPVDLKAQTIIDVRPQLNRGRFSEVILTTAEEFDTYKSDFRVAIENDSLIKRVLVSIPINDVSVTISTLDSITAGGGTWTSTGDATGLAQSSVRYIKNSASLTYNIGSSGLTTAGIQNSTLTAFDITGFLSNQVFHYQYLSNANDITNFKLRIGSSISDYYEMTVTKTHEETAFQIGWNLLRFDFTGATIVGSPTPGACTYVSVFMTKSVLKINQNGFYADDISLKRGEVYKLYYYSKYPWQNVSGTYLENSTSDSDYLVCDSDEFELFINKAYELASQEVSEDNVESNALSKYNQSRDTYEQNNPSKAKLLQTTYYIF
jgi:hypothetical protein